MRRDWPTSSDLRETKDSHVIIYADAQAYQALEGRYPAELLEHAKAESFGTEFLDYKMAVKTVKSFEDALGHIQENSSKHSECIVTENGNVQLYSPESWTQLAYTPMCLPLSLTGHNSD